MNDKVVLGNLETIKHGNVFLASCFDFELATDGYVAKVKAPAGLGFMDPDQADRLADKIRDLATSARSLNKDLQP